MSTRDRVADLENELADLKEAAEDLAYRVEDLETDDDDTESDNRVDLEGVVDGLADLQVAMQALATFTAAACVIENSGPYADDGFGDETRKAAKKLIEQRVKFGGSF